MTRCKFTCVSVTKRLGFKAGDREFPFVFDARFTPVGPYSYRQRESVSRDVDDAAKADDERFWAATPSGEMVVGTIAADHFEVGRDYYVDFTPVIAAAPPAAQAVGGAP